MIFVFLLATNLVFAQKKANLDHIKAKMAAQEVAWNSGDLAGFMLPYWHSDKLSFVGKSGVTYGWDATLLNYQKGYPDAATMGKLHFDIVETQSLDAKHIYMIGKWKLSREKGDIGGHFTLIWAKIAGQWLIISDHSS
jgi:ketosteroid isomerase-like protein